MNRILDWFSPHIDQHLYNLSMDLFAWVFKVLLLFLQTPPIFNVQYINQTTSSFSVISIGIVMLLTVYESLVQMLHKVSKKTYTKFTDVLKRLPVAIAAAGVTPFLFQEGFKIINKLTRGISYLGGSFLKNNQMNGMINLSSIDILGMFLLDAVLIGVLIPVLLQNVRRWWDLFCLSAVSPLAFTAWIFDRHRHLFHQWWYSIKKMSLVQLVYATFMVLMSVFIYGTRYVSGDFGLIRLLIIIGALYRISNPPNLVRAYVKGDTDDVEDRGKAYLAEYKKILNNILLRNFPGVPLLKKKREEQKAQIQKLRKKYNQRYIKNKL